MTRRCAGVSGIVLIAVGLVGVIGTAWAFESQWFECPCHGSKYNTAGEYKLGPAPRGMDRFKLAIGESGDVTVNTAEIILGPPRGTDTIHKPLAGPFCVAVQ